MEYLYEYECGHWSVSFAPDVRSPWCSSCNKGTTVVSVLTEDDIKADFMNILGSMEGIWFFPDMLTIVDKSDLLRILKGDSPRGDCDKLACHLMAACGGNASMAMPKSVELEPKRLIVSLHPGDMGRWIGKGGSRIKTMRDILRKFGADIELKKM